MDRNRSEESESQDLVPRRFRRRSVSRLMLERAAVGADELGPGVVDFRRHGVPKTIGPEELADEVRELLGKSTVHHVTASVSGADIDAGGATVPWTDEADAPTERRGFETFHEQLQDGAVGDIPLGLTGTLNWLTFGEWAEYRNCQTLSVTLLRDGSTVGDTVDYDLGPVTSRFFDEEDDGWEVQAGDTLRVELANTSGEVQTLTSMRFVCKIIGTTREAAATSDADAPAPAETNPVDGASAFGTITMDVADDVEDGDLLVAMLVSQAGGANTHPTGWTALSGSGSSTAVAWKLWSTGDPTSYEWSRATTGGAIRGLLFTIRGADPDDPVSGFTSVGLTTGVSPEDLTAPAGSAGDLLLSGCLSREAGGNADDKDMLLPVGSTVYYSAVNPQGTANNEHREAAGGFELVADGSPTVRWEGSWNSGAIIAVEVHRP